MSSHLHPEFGVLCPSQGFGRKLRASLFFLALLGMGALAMTSVRNFDADGASMLDGAARTEGPAAEALIEPQTNQTVGRAAVTDESPAPSESTKSECEKNALTSSHRNRECRTNGTARPRHTRAANEAPAIAALALGHKSLPLSAAAESTTDLSAAAENRIEATNMAATTPAVAEPSQPRRAAKNVSQSRRAHASSRSRIWRDERRTARAYYDRPLRRHYPSYWGWSW